jgi:hypothetical protein
MNHCMDCYGLLWIAMDCWCAMANKAKYSSSSGLSLEVYWVAAHVIEEQQHPSDPDMNLCIDP